MVKYIRNKIKGYLVKIIDDIAKEDRSEFFKSTKEDIGILYNNVNELMERTDEQTMRISKVELKDRELTEKEINTIKDKISNDIIGEWLGSD